jgi:hypothetical protein
MDLFLDGSLTVSNHIIYEIIVWYLALLGVASFARWRISHLILCIRLDHLDCHELLGAFLPKSNSPSHERQSSLDGQLLKLFV